jgi:CBS domain-containing protein
VNAGGIVLGRLGRRALAAEDGARVEDVMMAGPSTVRPSLWLDALAKRFRERDTRTALVTRADGSLVGVVRREDVPPIDGEEL